MPFRVPVFPRSRVPGSRMVIGVLQVELSLPGSHSLKDKRRLVKSLVDRLPNQFNVAAAEIDAQDNHRDAHLAGTCVNSESRAANQILSHTMAAVDREAAVAAVRDAMGLR